MRCIRARRTCGGYGDVFRPFSTFQLYGPRNPKEVALLSIARRCTIPRHTANVSSQDVFPPETSQEEGEELALRAFVYDYCTVSANKDLSRGYLSNLGAMSYQVGTRPAFIRACQAISLGSHGKVLRRSLFIEEAESIYHELLGSFARTIGEKTSKIEENQILMAMLLGLYQMAMASGTNRGDHVAHAKGLAAMMKLRGRSSDPCEATVLGDTQGPYSGYLQVSAVFSTSSCNSRDVNFVDLLSRLDMMMVKSKRKSEKKPISQLRQQCIELEASFHRWQDSRVAEFQPTTVGTVENRKLDQDIPVGFWPGNVDTYLDLYAAGVWNLCRGARLRLITMVIEYSAELEDWDSYNEFADKADHVAEQIAASVPYHLTDNLYGFLHQDVEKAEIEHSGKSLGGLLLMHPLYIAAQMQFISPKMRQYMQRCLVWIGQDMGIGQALVLATTSDIDLEYLTSSCMVIWAGFLS